MRFEKVSKEQFFNDIEEKCQNVLCTSCNYDGIKKPKRATMQSAGYDFYSTLSFTLFPGHSITIPTGIRAKLDADKCLVMLPRSGMGFKYSVKLANTIGLIDADYYNAKNEGHIMIKLDCPNDGVAKPLEVKVGDAICQGVIMQYFTTEDDDTNTIRTGGLGSTSK